MVMETTYNVGGLDAETDGLRPADIGCDILVDYLIIDRSCGILYIYL